MSDRHSPRPRGAMQRAKAALGRYGAISEIIAHHMVRGVVAFAEIRLGGLLMTLSPSNAQELARRHRERSPEGPHWFTADERALVDVLADLIVPSDEIAPGVAQMALEGRSVVETLDGLVAGSRPRQAVYARGLVALDRLAK